MGFVLLCLTNESYPSFSEKELWTFYQRLPRESVENNYLAFVVQWVEIISDEAFIFDLIHISSQDFLSHFDFTQLQVKFRFSMKATKFETISHMIWQFSCGKTL